jgi:1-acyl-sn-glycerol-3-phosphate acyltransferase
MAVDVRGHPSLGRPPFYRFATWVMRGYFRVLTDVWVRGRERVPMYGPLVVACNHLQWIDPVVLGAFFPRPVIFMAKQELWRRWLVGWIVERYGAFPVRRGGADRTAIRQAIAILDAGGAVGIFPEGTRSRVGTLKEPYPGASLIALKSGAPVLPVAIVTERDMHGTGWLGHRPRVDVTFGAPFRLSGGRGDGKGRLEEGTHTIMRKIAEILPPERRGAYGA